MKNISIEDLKARDKSGGYFDCRCERDHHQKQPKITNGCDRIVRGERCGARIVFSSWRVKR